MKKDQLDVWRNMVVIGKTKMERGQLTRLVLLGLSLIRNVKQSCAMRSLSEMDAPSEMFFLRVR